jgi:hypothetical protein
LTRSAVVAADVDEGAPPGHDPGRVIGDLVAMLADGGECVSADLYALRDQLALFGEVAADSTAYRVIEAIAADPALRVGLRAAHAKARSLPAGGWRSVITTLARRPCLACPATRRLPAQWRATGPLTRPKSHPITSRPVCRLRPGLNSANHTPTE